MQVDAIACACALKCHQHGMIVDTCSCRRGSSTDLLREPGAGKLHGLIVVLRGDVVPAINEHVVICETASKDGNESNFGCAVDMQGTSGIAIVSVLNSHTRLQVGATTSNVLLIDRKRSLHSFKAKSAPGVDNCEQF